MPHQSFHKMNLHMPFSDQYQLFTVLLAEIEPNLCGTAVQNNNEMSF